MILIKDRHNTVFYQEDDFIGRGKYDTYKGSTLIHTPSFVLTFVIGEI